MVNAAEGVVAIDKKPEPATFTKMPIPEGNAHVRPFDWQVDHRRVLPPARSPCPENPVSDLGIFVRNRCRKMGGIKGLIKVLSLSGRSVGLEVG